MFRETHQDDGRTSAAWSERRHLLRQKPNIESIIKNGRGAINRDLKKCLKDHLEEINNKSIGWTDFKDAWPRTARRARPSTVSATRPNEVAGEVEDKGVCDAAFSDRQIV